MKIASREVIEAFSREGYRKHYADSASSTTVGVMESARLLDRREFIFRGRAYHVAPVPWPLAAEIFDVRECFRTAKASDPIENTLALFERAARLSKRACRPAGFLRRLLWPLTPNPFRKATPWQVGQNLGFFWTCLALDQQPQWEAALRSGMYNLMLRGSSNASPLGHTQHGGPQATAASLSRGATS